MARSGYSAAGIGLRLVFIGLKFAAHHLLGTGLGFFGDSRMHLGMADFAGEVLAGDTLMGEYGTTMLTPGSYGYSITHWLYGATYQLLGSSPFMLHIFNSLFSCLSGLLVYLIVIRICSHKSSARMSMGLTLFMPSQIMWVCGDAQGAVDTALCDFDALSVYRSCGREKSGNTCCFCR